MTDYIDLSPAERLAVLREQCFQTNLEIFGDNAQDTDTQPAGAAQSGGGIGPGGKFGISLNLIFAVIAAALALFLPFAAAEFTIRTFWP